MKVTSKIIAAAIVAGVSAFALPASADYGDFGQKVYNERSESRFAPSGLPTGNATEQKADRGFSDIARQALFDRIDDQHKGY